MAPGAPRSPVIPAWTMDRMRFTNGSEGAERKRLGVALLLSLLIHALLLSLTFGGGLGLPGLGFPWQERRIEVPELRVVIVPPRIAPAAPAIAPVVQPRQQALVEQAVLGAPIVVPPAADANAPLRVVAPDDAAPVPIPPPAVIALAPPNEPTLIVPPAPPVPTPVIAAAPSASSPERALPAPRDNADEARERQAEQLEAARVEAARLETERQQAARQAAARQEAALQEAARQEAARIEIARQEAERQKAAQQAAARQEAELQEAARQKAAQIEATRLEAERQKAAQQAAARQEAEQQEAARQKAAQAEAARQEAERQKAAQQAAARQEAARVQAAEDDNARREAARRAMGRQLDEEAAARREAAAKEAPPTSNLPYSWSSARRGRLFGRTDPNAELVLYAEAWARKIHQNMTIDMVREAARRPHIDPVVTVAIRRDGSVESVTFVVSSGVPEIDDAVRRIVQSQTPYQAFSPALAHDFDVIEIRRTWHFDVAVRLY
ncbi:cell envelope integrity protein TolA [Aquincola sp. S2]|uniref:Cell envelope integrity protein TolA n=1 Tax=Pseudaquabacterium terrae TaxID=2732868 RepID=A0ABX2E9W2_9BURK|nr:cell envelope integrity protein TolA [Aquabacterium terrae]NRF65467.1 cell envelope integrity protein TolA [Aquabacterium terrae]